MRRPRNRRESRFKRSRPKHEYVKSANIIQKRARVYLENRYSGICRNCDDDDIFTMDPVYMIPRSLLVVLGGHGFNSCDMLKWVMRSTNPSHPITREDLHESVDAVCVDKILNFLSSDSKIICKKGYHKNRKKYKNVLILYHKRCLESLKA